MKEIKEIITRMIMRKTNNKSKNRNKGMEKINKINIIK